MKLCRPVKIINLFRSTYLNRIPKKENDNKYTEGYENPLKECAVRSTESRSGPRCYKKVYNNNGKIYYIITTFSIQQYNVIYPHSVKHYYCTNTKQRENKRRFRKDCEI